MVGLPRLSQALILERFWRDLIDLLLHPIGSNVFLCIEHPMSFKPNQIIVPYILPLHTFLHKINTNQFLNSVLNNVGQMTKIVSTLFRRLGLILMDPLLKKSRPLVPILMKWQAHKRLKSTAGIATLQRHINAKLR
ncbi:hypothetical protein GQ457_12G011590 [Hibiscus cannabinus]